MSTPDAPEKQHHDREALAVRRAEFRLLRDQILLGVGVFGVLGVALSGVLIGVKDPAITLASLTLFGTLLGAPAVLRLDERRKEAETE